MLSASREFHKVRDNEFRITGDVDPWQFRFRNRRFMKMRRMTERTFFLLAVTTVFLLTVSGTAHAQAGVTTKTGTLPDGATYLIEVPAKWNRTMFLYSQGYVPPLPNSTKPVPEADAPFNPI